MYQILSLSLFFSFLSQGCHNSHNASAKGEIKQSLVTSNEEKFDEFRKLFYSDSIFQISRIIFPLEIEKKIEEEYAAALKDSNIVKINKNNHIAYNKSNWNMLITAFSNNDSIAIHDGIRYKRRFQKSNNLIEEDILFADDGLLMVISKFKLIDNKWYLIDFEDGFADE